jgi:endonuclease/exonuclease/phosphatase family metal-dependent hydrolase
VIPLPENAEQVSQYLKKAEEHVSSVIQELIALPDLNKTPEAMMRPWNRLANELLGYFKVLSYLAEEDSFLFKEQAAQGVEALKRFVYVSMMQNQELYYAFMGYIRGSVDKQLSAYDREQICSLLDSFSDVGDSKEVELLKQEFSRGEKKPFLYLESPYTPAKHTQSTWKVLTLNTCFISDDFPYLYGGATLPWQDRVKPLAQKAMETRADVLCFQEVFSEDAFQALYEELQKEYKYFYGAIGPRFLGLSLKTIGLSSGLCIASKYPLELPRFTLFSKAGFPMNYGVFDFVVRKEGTVPGHCYVTHMQSLDQEAFLQIRDSQLGEIIAKMEEDQASTKEKMLFFLCGDLNIPWNSFEPAEKRLRSYFYDGYTEGQKIVDESNSTCTYYFTNYLLSKTKNPNEIDPKFQILDYGLIPNSLLSKYSIKTTRILMNDLKQPETATSDHHGLLAEIQEKLL